MANPEHLNQLRAGQWNEWRAANPTLSPDLIDAKLAGLDLREINFSKAHMRGVDLTGSQLDGADLLVLPIVNFELHDEPQLLISTSTPADSSSFMRASRVCWVGSMMSIIRLWVRISNCSRDFLST